jgi:hypothetical protein
MSKPKATVKVIPLPNVAEGCFRVEVACPASTTGTTHVPGGPIAFTKEMAITFTAFSHEERCEGDCDLAEVHAQGDQRVKDWAEQMHAAMQAQAVKRRRN